MAMLDQLSHTPPRLSLDGHLDSLHFLTSVNSAPVSMGVQVSLWPVDLDPFGCTLRSSCCDGFISGSPLNQCPWPNP